MKSDLDALMEANGVDVLLISGPAQHNPAMVYFTGTAHLMAADLIKKRGEEPVLFHFAMERDEAAKSGLRTIGYEQFASAQWYQQANGDAARITALRYQAMLQALSIQQGRVLLYGLVDQGTAFGVFSLLREMLPGIELAGDGQEKVLRQAMATKDANEVARIRWMGQVTTQVVGQTADFLSSQSAKDGVLVNSTGEPVTIGEVKRRISLWLAEAGVDNPEDTIFAIGRDSAVPHSTGTPTDLIRLGKTIVYDIFPCEKGGGYFYDFTRTWCLGYAPDDAWQLYNQVHQVYQTIYDELRLGQTCSYYQNRACELFEAMGHPTQRTDPRAEEGYPHGLGHGVGLYLQARPWFRLKDPNNETLQPGTVMTLEPGLYYPDRELGMRLENTLWLAPDGHKEVLADFPMDLVLPVRQG